MDDELAEYSSCLQSDLQRIGECNAVPELIEELQRCCLGGLELWIKAAAILARIKKLSPDVDIRIDVGRYLSRMNIPGRRGPLLPELFSAMMSRPRLLDTVMRYPFSEQRTLADHQPVKVFSESGDHRLVSWELMAKLERDQVFGRDHIRTESEQLSWIREQRSKEKIRNSTLDTCPVIVDKKKKCIIVNGYSMSFKELMRYASEIG